LNSSVEEQEKVLESVKCVLYKIRSITKISRSSNIIQNHVLKLIREDSNLGKITMFMLDFFIRWNSTQLMIQRFLKLKKVVISLTTNACDIDGIKPSHLTKLNKWSLSVEDWQLVKILDFVLLPFLQATQIISGQNYPTLPISHIVYCSLKHHLSKISEVDEEKILKQILLEKLEYHFNTKLSQRQLDVTLVKLNFF
jgi:hypothetical protein